MPVVFSGFYLYNKIQIKAQQSGFDLEKEEQRNKRALIFSTGIKKSQGKADFFAGFKNKPKALRFGFERSRDRMRKR